MADGSPKWTDPDPHYSTNWSIPEGNVPRWTVLALLGFFGLQLVLIAST